MIKIKISKTKIRIRGHGGHSVCNWISGASQLILKYSNQPKTKWGLTTIKITEYNAILCDNFITLCLDLQDDGECEVIYETEQTKA